MLSHQRKHGEYVRMATLARKHGTPEGERTQEMTKAQNLRRMRITKGTSKAGAYLMMKINKMAATRFSLGRILCDT
ncbi:hypothetical protein MNBD_PLANCTO03-619 [hydrothermal vent metagenome]|uniref:Uncharacterized protein n=1 Tax=hydrothermal vent metagenome TaxID=652676 RepID=A0A3B1E8M4_9ZZZZ